MKLSVIVPVYNEAPTVKKVLGPLAGVKEVKEVIVVNDGSTDDTEKEIKKILNSKNPDIKKIQYFKKKNGGKGSAVRLGLTKVTGDYTLIQDADLEYDPREIPLLLEPLDREGVEVVFGSRFIGSHSNLLFWHRVGNGFLNFVVNLLYNTTLSDMETCYKLLPTDLFRKLNISANAFDMEPEITCKLLRRGCKIFEVPISYVGRDFSQGKKITWRDGLDAFRVVLGIRFLPPSLFKS
ncbi:glycosyltransferase family 2 protein [Patescibacteria group bacterium]|nr:glycosyltransferase family 2 protein [Patescibacteria group bacterium]MBU1967155.1 glycosyltransferase family 2 protein [Patescibacteria group bacterium]